MHASCLSYLGCPIRLDPAPRRHAQAPRTPEQAEELPVDLVCAASMLRKRRHIPFHRPAAGALEVEPAEPIGGSKDVPKMGFTVERPLFESLESERVGDHCMLFS